MRRLLVSVLAIAASGCSGILGIPSEGEVGCPAPCKVTVSGKVIRADSVNNRARSNVTVLLTSTNPAVPTTSGADGAYAFGNLDPDTPLEFEVSFAQSNPDPSPLLFTRYFAGNTSTSDLPLDLPVVEFRWLAQVAQDCDPVRFPTLDDALYADPVAKTGVNPYFTSRSTVIVEVKNEDGSAAALDRADITVKLDTFNNFQDNPADDADMKNPPVATVCFLEGDALGTYRGVNSDHSSSGRFVVFRARNGSGTGTGPAEVRVPSFPIGRVNMSSGSVGFVRIKLAQGVEVVPPRDPTFERDIYPLFHKLTCSDSCHRPGGLGFMMAPVRTGSDGVDYPADWSGVEAAVPVQLTATQYVYKALTQPPAIGCDAGTPARVCVASPDMSLLFTKPRAEGGGMEDHLGVALPPNDPNLLKIKEWIRLGANF